MPDDPAAPRDFCLDSRALVKRHVVAVALALLLPAWIPMEADASEALQDGSQEQAPNALDGQVEELARALGMTPAEIEALQLTPEEIQLLLDGFAQETVVVGSRAQPRSATSSAVPVDVLSTTDIVSQGAGDLREQLRTVIPSFNVNTQPIAGASTVIRPAMLRNLAPDHTLILVNGKRRHRASNIDWVGGNGVAFGSQGPDISAIPAIALRQVEVLRDGAAAQYGSDAIAGVMNFQLIEGDPASWAVGPYGPQGFTAGSNGFFGYGPVAAGRWDRSNVAAYGDIEATDTDADWTIGTAVRVEEFEDFGTTLNGKVSGRIGFVRAGMSTGFRAPRSRRLYGSGERGGRWAGLEDGPRNHELNLGEHWGTCRGSTPCTSPEVVGRDRFQRRWRT